MDTTRSLSSGTVTFLFTDIEGSTKLWDAHPEAMRVALVRHDAIVRAAIETTGGQVFKTVGDQFCAAFASAPDALAAALSAQRALHDEPWSEVGPVRVRMALHTGAAEQREGDYFGPPLNRVARVLDAGHGSQILISQAAADLIRDTLPQAVTLRDLGAHRLKDLQKPEHLFQFVHPDLPRDFPPLRSLEAFAHNLPRQLTSFIGREREIEEVKQCLAATALLTLTGSGGCGKTRLSLQIAADLVEEFADGVWLVELAALADPALVAQTAAEALGIREEPGRPATATLVDYLRSRSLLLVLDNCEHLLAACAQLVERLLRGCPKLRVLASSREGLGIMGEQTYRVPSLSLPAGDRLSSVEQLQSFEAVRLFVERAALSQPSFALTPGNAAAVVGICRRLDGIPLAIELAATRVKALPVEQLAARLDDRFRLLTGGSRTALPRQQTLRALIDWSYDLLSELEQMQLRRLSVFTGGWTLEAAEAVCGGDGIEEWQVLDLLTSLVDKSLVQYEERNGAARYRLLETVRQYGRERLLEAGEAPTLRDRHRDWFLALAEQAEPMLRGPEQAVWLDRLEVEHNNLRSALEWCKETPGGDQSGLRLAAALSRFWYWHEHWNDRRQWLDALLERTGSTADEAVRAKALVAASDPWWRRPIEDAVRMAEEGLALFRSLGDRRGIASALWELGEAARAQGDQERAAGLWEEVLVLYRELGDRVGAAAALCALGGCALHRGEHEQAKVLGEESLALHRQLGNQQGVVETCDLLGNVARLQGRHDQAVVAAELGLSLSRELGHRQGVAQFALKLGEQALRERLHERAAELFEESVAAAREANMSPRAVWGLTRQAQAALHLRAYEEAVRLCVEGLAVFQEIREGLPHAIAGWRLTNAAAQCLEVMAACAAAQGQSRRASKLLGGAEAVRRATSEPLLDPEATDRDSSLTAVRSALGEQAFATMMAEGSGMSLEQAIAYALDGDTGR